MRAPIQNLTIAQGAHEHIEWPTTRIFDAPVELPLKLAITKQNLALGRGHVQACAIAQSCRDRDFSFFGVGVDVAWVGAFLGTEPVRLRYRSGNLPKKFDKAVKNLHDNGVFDVRHLETDNYVLRPPTENYTLEYKKKQNKERVLQSKPVTKRRPNNKKPDVSTFTGRGRLRSAF